MLNKEKIAESLGWCGSYYIGGDGDEFLWVSPEGEIYKELPSMFDVLMTKQEKEEVKANKKKLFDYTINEQKIPLDGKLANLIAMKRQYEDHEIIERDKRRSV